MSDFGKPAQEIGELRLVQPKELDRVTIHPTIKEVIEETRGLAKLHDAMHSKRLPEISKLHPAIILRTRQEYILVGHFMYFYEALIKKRPVYARVIECTNKVAHDQVIEEAYTRPLHVNARQGEGLKIPDKKGNPQTTQLTKTGKVLLQEIYNEGEVLNRVLAGLRKLAPLEVAGQILHFPHTTISNWTSKLGYRIKPQRGKAPEKVLDRPEDWLPLPPPREKKDKK